MNPLHVVLVYEDELSAAVLRRLLAASNRNFVVSREVHARGYGAMKRDVRKYEQASQVLPHIILTDLDRVECPSVLLSQWKLNSQPGRLVFRVAVREIEAWVLADRNGVADFLGLPVSKVPVQVESIPDPKQVLLSLARGTKNRKLMEELVPPMGSTSSIGPFYNDRLSGFVMDKWNLDTACSSSKSLAKALQRIKEFASEGRGR
ncbi:MAG: hypothetical protein QM724_11780 [Flavobacteriales bacterium]